MLKQTILSICILVIFVIPSFCDAYADKQSRIDNIKLAFFLKFPLFVNWEMSGWDVAKSLRFCFLEGDRLSERAKKELPVNDTLKTPVEVYILKSPKEIQTCHVAYFSADDPELVKPYLDVAQGHAILTINEDDWFTNNGGVMRFYHDELQRLRFEINFDTSRKIGLRLDSRLLRIARIKRSD
jgi:hypothetical protein